MITGEWSRNSLLRVIMAMFLVYIALFCLTAALMYFERMGVDPESVVLYFQGDPDQEFGRPARTYGSMVETSHIHLFAMGMLVMVLTHLLLFIPIPNRLKGLLVSIAFGATLLDETSNWLVRFVHPAFAYLKVASFVVMEASLSGLVILIALYLWRPIRNAFRDSHQPCSASGHSGVNRSQPRHL